MADIRLIALDIDGTLLDDVGGCSAFTLETLDIAQKAGIYICAATARPERHTRNLPFAFDGIACLAGAKVSAGDTLVARAAYAMSDAQMLHSCFINRYPNATISVEAGDAFFGNFENEVCQKRDILAQPEQPVDKMYFSLPDDGAGDYLTSILPEGIHGTRYHSFMLVMREGVDKLFGVRALCRHFGTTLDNTIALGNDADDLCMVNAAAFGAILLNAPEHVRTQAQRITKRDNNDDGAAWYIRDVIGL